MEHFSCLPRRGEHCNRHLSFPILNLAWRCLKKVQDGRSHVVGRVSAAVALSHRIWRRPSLIFLCVCVCGEHWLWHRDGCCACAHGVGVMLFLPGEVWWQWGQALGALCEQHDLTSSVLLLGTWLCHGTFGGTRLSRGGDLEHLSCAAIPHKGTACSAAGWVRNETKLRIRKII